MSNAILNKAWEQDLPPGPKVVLISLADQANDEGVCWPAIPQIAKRCGINDRSVSRHVSKLEQMGVIKREVVTGRGTIYHLVFANNKSIEAPDTVSPPPDTVSSQPLTRCHHTPDTVSSTPDTVSSKPSVTIKNPQERGNSLSAEQYKTARHSQSQIPEEFTPDRVAEARAKSTGLDLDSEVERFVLHYQANGEFRSDWQAQFKKWLMDSAQRKADVARRESAGQQQKTHNPFAGAI